MDNEIKNTLKETKLHEEKSNGNNTYSLSNDIWDDLMTYLGISEDTNEQKELKNNIQDNDFINQLNQSEIEKNDHNEITLNDFDNRSIDTSVFFETDETLNIDSIFADSSPSILLNNDDVISWRPESENNNDELDPMILFSKVNPVPNVSSDTSLEILLTGDRLVNIDDDKNNFLFPDEEINLTSKKNAITVNHDTNAIILNNSHESFIASEKNTIANTDSPEKICHDKKKINNKILSEVLLESLGLDHIQSEIIFTKEKLKMLGRLINIFFQGNIDLLSSTSIFKNKIKSSMANMLIENNNPFKLLPNSKHVLMQILNPNLPGFMSAEDAVCKTLTDLQAHQLGLISGIQALVTELLQALSPETLEKESQSMMGSNYYFKHKNEAMLWDNLVKKHYNISYQIKNNFYSFLSENFLEAYLAEIKRYKRSQL